MKKALIVLHQKSSEAGNLENKLIERKFDLEFICPALGDSLPLNLEHYDAIIILGGPMSANDNDDFIKNEIDWIGQVLKSNVPFLGICLGAQMLAKHLGCTDRMERHEYGNTITYEWGMQVEDGGLDDGDFNEYRVLTDEEADELAYDYIMETLWAFSSSFLAGETGIDEEVFIALANNGKCEGNNDAIASLIKQRKPNTLS